MSYVYLQLLNIIFVILSSHFTLSFKLQLFNTSGNTVDNLPSYFKWFHAYYFLLNIWILQFSSISRHSTNFFTSIDSKINLLKKLITKIITISLAVIQTDAVGLYAAGLDTVQFVIRKGNNRSTYTAKRNYIKPPLSTTGLCRWY